MDHFYMLSRVKLDSNKKRKLCPQSTMCYKLNTSRCSFNITILKSEPFGKNTYIYKCTLDYPIPHFSYATILLPLLEFTEYDMFEQYNNTAHKLFENFGVRDINVLHMTSANIIKHKYEHMNVHYNVKCGYTYGAHCELSKNVIIYKNTKKIINIDQKNNDMIVITYKKQKIINKFKLFLLCMNHCNMKLYIYIKIIIIKMLLCN